MVDVPLSPEAVALLRELAAKSGVTVEEFARSAILDRMEDLEDALLAAERLQSGDGQSVSLEEVIARFGGRSAAE